MISKHFFIKSAEYFHYIYFYSFDNEILIQYKQIYNFIFYLASFY